MVFKEDAVKMYMSKIIQKEKNRYCILMYIYIWYREKWYWSIYLQGKQMQMWRMDSWRQGGTNWESSSDLYALTRVKQKPVGSCRVTQRALPGALWWRRGAGWGEGGRESLKREGICLELWLHHAAAQQKPIQCCKAIILPLKNKLIFKKMNVYYLLLWGQLVMAVSGVGREGCVCVCFVA